MHLTDPVCHGPGNGASVGHGRPDATPGHVEPAHARLSRRILNYKAGGFVNRLARAAPARPAGDAQR